MNTIRIRRRVRSATLRLPELAGLIGKEVDIVVTEAPPTVARRRRLKAFFEAAGTVGVDSAAVRGLRNASKL